MMLFGFYFSSVADRIQRITRSIELHEDHNILAGFPCHYARDAALAARLPHDALRSALGLHRAANAATCPEHKRQRGIRVRWATKDEAFPSAA